MKFRKKPVVVEATQWHVNGDHPDDESVGILPADGSQPCLSEGKIVRRYRRPDVAGDFACSHCGCAMYCHGWIDTMEGGYVVCPGDWIITGIKGERYPCKPDIFEATYDKVMTQLLATDALAGFREAASKHGHSLSETPCSACGDLNGCHWPAKMQPFANRPLVVCLCGSTRFWETFRDQGLKLTLDGMIILSIGICAPDSMVLANPDTAEGKEQKVRLDHLHRCKVEMADVVFILNVGGYIGESTQGELAHAKKCGKVIMSLEPLSC